MLQTAKSLQVSRMLLCLMMGRATTYWGIHHRPLISSIHLSIFYLRLCIHACVCVHKYMIAQIRKGILFNRSNALYTGMKAQATTAITLRLLLLRMRTMNTTSRGPSMGPLTCYMPPCCRHLWTRPLQNKSRPNLTSFSRTQDETHKQTGTSLIL